ncbi:MAG: tetratricopeptide repeat protein, partial [Myxococcota bacterium]
QYADLLFKLERFDAAANEYAAVVDPNSNDGKNLVAAANDNILALDEHLRDLDLQLPSDLDEKTEFHPQHRRLADACRRYLRFVPEEADESAEKRPAVKLKLARVLYAYNDFEPALEMFDALVKSHPRSEQAVVAANLVVDVHNLRKDWPSLYDAARRYVDDPDLVRGRPELKTQLSRYGEYAKFALIQKLKEDVEAEEGDLSSVARGFEEFHREFPKSENADQALFNASVLYDKLGLKDRANGLRQRLLADYPDSELRSDVAFYLAKQHEQRTEYGKAAVAFRSFAREFPKDPRARDALYDASVFYAGTGQARTAVKVREEYLSTYGRKRRKSRSESAAVEFAIAQDLERGRRLGDAARAYAAFAKRYALDPLAFDAMWREAKVHRRLRRISTAEKVEGRILGTVLWMKKKGRRVPPNARRYASLVAYSRLDERFEKYRKSRLPTPNLRNPRPFQRALKQLARDRDKVIRRYEAIIKDYKQAEASIAALYRIARAWDVFSDAITKVRCPRGAGRDVCDVLRTRMEELSLPARDSAVEAYGVCVDRAAALETFTSHATRCARRLETVAPAQAPRVVEKIAAPRPAARLTGLQPGSLMLKRSGAAPEEKTASREVSQ